MSLIALALKTVPKYSQQLNNKSYTIGYIKETLESPALNVEVKIHILENRTTEKSGHKVVELDFPYLNYVVPTYYILTTAEASSVQPAMMGYTLDASADVEYLKYLC